MPERQFEGVWIPKDLWLTKELTIIEKCLYREILSLHGVNGCYATNNHFKDFLGISLRGTKDVIHRLVEKKWIRIEGNTRNRVIIPLRAIGALGAQDEDAGLGKNLPPIREETSKSSISEQNKKSTRRESASHSNGTGKDSPLPHLRKELTEKLIELSPDPKRFNFKREGQHITTLLKLAEQEAEPELWLRSYLNTAYRLWKGKRGIWKTEKPFLPSIIVSQGIQGFVLEAMKNGQGGELTPEQYASIQAVSFQ